MSQGVAAFLSIVPRKASWLGIPCLSRLCKVLVMFLWAGSLAQGAESVTLAWTPSSSIGVVGYRVYYGTASGSYSSSKDAGNVTITTICCLEPSQIYYFAARAYLANGELSGYSEEVSFRTQQGLNTPPYFNELGDTSITADGTRRDIAITGIRAGVGAEDQPLRITATSSRPDLLPAPTVTYTSPGSTATIRIAPALYASGVATITVTIDDGQSSNSSFSRSFDLTMNSPQTPNTPPTFGALGDISITSDGTQRDVPITGIQAGAAGENQPLTITTSSSRPDLVPAPTVIYTSPGSTGTLRIKPAPSASGVATITVTINDGQSSNNSFSRTFNVTAVRQSPNTPPTFNPLGDTSITTDGARRDIPITGILAGTTAGENQPLTITTSSSRPDLIPAPIVTYTSPASTASIRIAPVPNANGVATITVTIDDGQSSNSSFSRSFVLTMKPLNTPPTFSPLWDTSITADGTRRDIPITGILAGTTAGENQPLTITTTSSRPDLIPAPVVTYTSPASNATIRIAPVVNASGIATITVTINDGQPSNNLFSRSFNLTMRPRVLQLNEIADLTVPEDSKPRTIPITGIDAGDPEEAQPLNVTAISSLPSLIPHPLVSYQSPNSTGSLTFWPTPERSGVATITVLVTDAQASNVQTSRTFKVTVYPLNDAPQLDPIGDVTLEAGSEPTSLALTGINSGASNEIQRLSVSATSSVPSLVPNPIIQYLSPDSKATLTLTPVADASGIATITVTVSDGQSSNGHVSRSFDVEVLATPTNSYYFEAESASIQSPMETAAGAGASQSSFAFSRVAEQGRLTFAAPIRRTGEYYAWARVLSPSSSSDSFYLSVDQGQELTIYTALRQWSDEWQWVQLKDWTLTNGLLEGTPRQLHLDKGSHDLSIRTREPFTFLDAIFLSTDPDSAPPSPTPASIAVDNIPYPLQVSQIGTLKPGCKVSLVSGEYSLTGIGSLAANDELLFLHQPMSNDGGITVRLGFTETLSTNGFVGIMVRDDLGSRASYVALGSSGGEGLTWRVRTNPDATATVRQLPLSGRNAWLHIRRFDNTLTAYASPDGFGWTLIESIQQPFSSSVQIGLVVTSGDPQSLYTTTFTDLSFINSILTPQ